MSSTGEGRGANELCRVWSGRDGWTTLTLVVDCHMRESLSWHLSRSGKSKAAEAALEQALIDRFGTSGKETESILLRSDNGLIFTNRNFTRLVRSDGLNQEFIFPHSPEQSGMADRVIRTLKERCVHRQRVETLQQASRAIAD